MIAFRIAEIGPFLNTMLKGTMFDHFLLQEADISQAVDFHIDGTLNGGYYSPDELEEQGLSGCGCIPFEKVRQTCFDLIKGKRKPGYFKFVFLLSPQNQAVTIEKSGSSFRTEDVAGMYINLIYKNDVLMCTTGISYRMFSMDKTLEKEWDRMAALFFRKNGVATEDI